MLHNLYNKLKENCEIFQAISKNSPPNNNARKLQVPRNFNFFRGVARSGDPVFMQQPIINSSTWNSSLVSNCLGLLLNSNRCQGALDQKMKTWQQFLQFSSFNPGKLVVLPYVYALKMWKMLFCLLAKHVIQVSRKMASDRGFDRAFVLMTKHKKNAIIYVKSVGLTS